MTDSLHELEQKYAVREHQPFLDKVKQYGGKYVSTTHETNYILQVGHGLLRLRTDPFQLTFKVDPEIIMVAGEPVRKCIEANLHVPRKARPAVVSFFKPLPVYHKERKSYRMRSLDDLKVEFDSVEELGTYLELEGRAERVVEGRKLLGLRKEDLEPRTYTQMIVEKWVRDGKTFPTFSELNGLLEKRLT